MNCRVMIIDDNRMFHSAISEMLNDQDYCLSFSSEGNEALVQMKNDPPDIVLLDVMMPNLSGFEVCRQMRNDPRLSDIVVIMITALNDRESKILGLEAGADDYLTKPIDRLELRARLRTISRLDRFRKLRNTQEEVLQSNQRLIKAYDETLEGWAKALELREQETAGHSKRVVDLTLLLACEVGVQESDIPHIHRGALLHDIGKIGIPDSILLKPDSLSEEEWAVMRKHPLFAFDLLSKIEYLKPSLSIPLYHHEKWDGSGYPYGLKGDEIPLAARIFSIVDVYDALSSVRPYRSAWSKSRIIDYLVEESSKQFDPSVVEAFLKLIMNQSDFLFDGIPQREP